MFSSDTPFASLEHKEDATLRLCQNVHSLFCILTFPTVAVAPYAASSPIGMNASYLQNTKLSHKHIFFKTRTTITLQVNSSLVNHSLTCHDMYVKLHVELLPAVSHSQLIFTGRLYTYTLCITSLYHQSHKVSGTASNLALFNELQY